MPHLCYECVRIKLYVIKLMRQLPSTEIAFPNQCGCAYFTACVPLALFWFGVDTLSISYLVEKYIKN